MRIVFIELLRGYIHEIHSYDELVRFIDMLSAQSVLAEHWVNNLIKPVLIMMLYVRAEREADFSLHLYACKEMILYFFAAGHVNYARYSICYMRSMEKLPGDVINSFMNGQHVVRHQRGFWNAIWSDMGIETSFMKFGKGPEGIIGVTTKPQTVKIWAKSLHACNDVLNDLNNLLGKDEVSVLYHKEEGHARIASDENDRRKVREFLNTCIHPLDINSHNVESVCNIYTGETAPSDININKSVILGEKMMLEFQNKLPEGFKATISRCVVPMSVKKAKSNAATPEYNTELIFSRVMYLMSMGQIELEDIFNYELSPIPTSLFKNTGEPRYPKNKSDLKNKLKVEISSRGTTPDSVFIDGCAALYSAIHWPKGGKVSDLIEALRCYISRLICKSDVYLIFDRYFDFSIKSDTRIERLGTFLRSHSLSLSAPLPPREITMKSTKTKVQLIQLISKELISIFTSASTHNKLIITSKEDCPQQTYLGQHREREKT